MFRNLKSEENGNVLFLILIAVALFAALSYAVTQSTQTGGGSSDNEQAVIESAQIIQYPASVRTSVVRQIINGVDIANLEFNPPSDFGNCSSDPVCVFHPSGGGASHTTAPASAMASGAPGKWYYNAHFEVVNLGLSSAAASAGNEIMVFLPGITESVCNKINQRLGITGDTVAAADISANYTQEMIGGSGYSIPSSETILGQAAGTNTLGLETQPFGCFRNGAAGEFVYYHVIVEQ